MQLWADGNPSALIAAVLFCSTATVSRWVGRYRALGLTGMASVRPWGVHSWRETHGIGWLALITLL